MANVDELLVARAHTMAFKCSESACCHHRAILGTARRPTIVVLFSQITDRFSALIRRFQRVDESMVIIGLIAIVVRHNLEACGECVGCLGWDIEVAT